ncbi:MAG: mannose-1-phosphate guanylyltransferase [Bdellovibrionales bacterium RIFOXYD1_FULL_53_11]|nr:MAG: mannose-1-phosphate guanylyltransferase [Bdellovibrionales bacterium RIFOXYD1_FULL_53_11]
MKALLLCAGKGTRLRPITDYVPKCLVPVAGRPLLGYWLEFLVRAGVRDILVNTHYMARAVGDFVRQSGYSKYVTMVYEKILLGTGGTLLKNRKYFGDSTVMLAHADNLSMFDFSRFAKVHLGRPSGTEITMMTFKTDTPRSCGIIKTDRNGIVKGFFEKKKNPPGNTANAAVYLLDSSVIDFLASLNKKKIDFSTEVLPSFVGKIFTFHNSHYHRDIGTVRDYLIANSPDSVRKLSKLSEALW